MILLDNLSQLPRKTVFRAVVSKLPVDDADYCYLHKSLMFYSCYFNKPVVELKKRTRRKNESSSSM